MNNPVATIIMENGAVIELELLPELAPNTVNSFIFLASSGAFDGHAIQRIVPGYVADMSYDAFGKDICKYLIANEARASSEPGGVKIEPGTIAMGGYDGEIAGGEFFFPLAYHEKLDGNYPVFGKVTAGIEEIMRWETVPLSVVPLDPAIEVNEPVEPIVIRSVHVDTFGVEYPEPSRLPMINRPPNWL